nr:MAG TPA_asm: hypothetical protein [Caudoviricetes sp.]
MLAAWSTLVGCAALVYHYFKDRHATGLLPSPCALSWVFLPIDATKVRRFSTKSKYINTYNITITD